MSDPTSPLSILVSDGLAAAGLDQLRRQAEVILDDRTALGSVDAWIVRGASRVDSAALSAATPRLRVVGRAGVGVDNIDLEAARRLGVTVVTAPEATTTAVAELTLGLMLALARHIPAADAAVRRGDWPKSSLIGRELDGKVLGLIGFGRIGRAVAARASAFGMSLEAFDPYLDDESIRAGGAEPRPLSAILAAGDFLSLHLPLTPETRNFLDHGRIGQMKRGACLICTARGGVVDEQALHQALKEGRLAGAALDVFTQEPPGALALLQHPHFIATPHLGAQTAEAQDRVALEIVREVMATLRGEAPRARVA